MGFNMNHTMKPETFTSLLILETISSCTICLEWVEFCSFSCSKASSYF